MRFQARLSSSDSSGYPPAFFAWSRAGGFSESSPALQKSAPPLTSSLHRVPGTRMRMDSAPPPPPPESGRDEQSASVLPRAGAASPRPLAPGQLLFSVTSWRNGSASDSRSEGCVFKSRRGHSFTFSHRANRGLWTLRASVLLFLCNSVVFLSDRADLEDSWGYEPSTAAPCHPKSYFKKR